MHVASPASGATPGASVRAPASPVIGIVTALPAEARIVDSRYRRAGDMLRTSSGGFVHAGGIGANRAANGARLLTDAGVSLLVSFGVAAGLDARATAGTLVVPSQVIRADGQRFDTDGAWRDALSRHLHAPAMTGTLLELDRIAATPADKAHAAQGSGCVAADMESGAVAATAARAGIPFICIRAVSDDAGTALPPCALNAVDASGAVRPLALAGALLRSPGALPGLLRLGRDFRRARGSLKAAAAALTLAGQSLSRSSAGVSK